MDQMAGLSQVWVNIYAVAFAGLYVRLWKPWCDNLEQTLNSFEALVVKNLPANAGDMGDMGLTSGPERSPAGGNGSPLQHARLEDPVDGGAGVTVNSVTKSQTLLSVHH